MENTNYKLSARSYGKSLLTMCNELSSNPEELKNLMEKRANDELEAFWNSEEGKLKEKELLQNFKDSIIYGKRS